MENGTNGHTAAFGTKKCPLGVACYRSRFISHTSELNGGVIKARTGFVLCMKTSAREKKERKEKKETATVV